MKKCLRCIIAIVAFMIIFTCACSAEELSLSQEEVLVDQNSIKITATGIQEDAIGTSISLKLNIENNSDQEITVYSSRTSINGLMIDGVIAQKVGAHTTSKGSISFQNFILKEAGIIKIGEVETRFHIVSDSMDFETNAVCVKTSLYGTFAQTYDDTGDILLDELGIKLIKKDLTVNDYVSGHDFYVENNLENAIQIKALNNVVNGIEMESSLSFPIVEGAKKAVFKLSFMNAELTKKGISSINSLSSHFIFIDAVTQDVILERDLSFEGEETVGVISAPDFTEGKVYSDQIVEVSVANLNIDNMGESTMDISIKNVGNEKVSYSSGKIRVNGKEITGYTGKTGTPDFLEEIPIGSTFDTILRMHRNGFAEKGITEISSLEVDLSFLMESVSTHDVTVSIPFADSEASTNVVDDFTRNANDYVVDTYFIKGSNRTSVVYELTNPNDIDVSLKGIIKFKNANGDVISTQEVM